MKTINILHKVEGVDFSKLNFFTNKEDIHGDEYIDLYKTTRYERLNYSRNTTYYKDNKDGTYDHFCVSYCKVDGDTLHVYDLSLQEMPESIKEYLNKYGYRQSLHYDR